MSQKNRIYVGSDHAGFALKQYLLRELAKEFLDLEFLDCGCQSADSVDYPLFAEEVAKSVVSTKSQGILVCGSGIGMCIAANKIKGILAAQAWNMETTRLSREHNNSNVLCIGARVLDDKTALEMTKTWLKTEFLGGRHQRRVDQIQKMET